MYLGNLSIFWYWITSIALGYPLIGPDGPLLLGVSSHAEFPFYPSETDGYYGYESMWVDPASGFLKIASEDASGVIRRFNGTVWEMEQEVDGIDYQKDQTRLSAVKDFRGGLWRYSYDASGQIREINWPNGGVIRIRYTTSGRVRQILGPSTERLTFEWGTDLKINKSTGSTYKIEYSKSTDSTINGFHIEDNLGRHTKLQEIDNMVQFRDPRGLQTSFSKEDYGIQIKDVQGGVWRALVNDGELTQIEGGAGRWEWLVSEDQIRVIEPGGFTQINRKDDQNRIIEQAVGKSLFRYSYSGDNKLREIRDGLGHSIFLGYDLNGRVRRIEDASGGAFVLQRNAAGQISQITGRSGQNWQMERDVMGRIKNMVTPEGITFALQRNLRGEIISIEEAFLGAWTIARGANGQPTRLITPDGDSFLFDYGNQNEIRRVVLPDKTQYRYSYDRMGWLSAFEANGVRSSILRDSLGRVQQWGEHRIAHDTGGNIIGIDNWLSLGRNMTGALSSVSVDDYVLSIGRDSQGSPVSWSDNYGELTVSRDRSGRITRSMYQVETHVQRDPRGWVISATQGNLGWRYLRASSGHLLKSVLSTGPSLGFERDSAMNLNWIRYPSGLLQRFDWKARQANVQLWDSSGQLLSNHDYAFDDQCLIREFDDKNGAEHYFERDWTGALRNVSASETTIYQRTDTQQLSRDGTVVTYDPRKKAASAIVSPPFQPYGTDITSWNYQRDEAGNIIVLDGQVKALFVERDPLGRLSKICAVESCWHFQYSPLGNLVAFIEPDGFWVPVLWRADAADQSFSDAEAIMIGASQLLSFEGQILLHNQSGVSKSFVYDIQGTLGWVGTSENNTPVSSGYTSLMSGHTGISGSSCNLQPSASGPVFCGPLSRDSISGDPLSDHRLIWPSMFHPAFDVPDNPSLKVALQLGLLPEPLNHHWKAHQQPPAVQWLSPQIESSTRLYGQIAPRLSLPFESTEWWLIERLLQADIDPSSAEFVAHMLGSESSLDKLKSWPVSNYFWWLQQDIFYPGLAYFSEMDKKHSTMWWE